MYFITCFEKNDIDVLGRLSIGKSRTFGYYDNFDEADMALRMNYGDMYETIYHYAVIECLRQGIHPRSEERWFYKYSEERDAFCPIPEPKAFEYYTNLALG